MSKYALPTSVCLISYLLFFTVSSCRMVEKRHVCEKYPKGHYNKNKNQPEKNIMTFDVETSKCLFDISSI
jgi:hypothetical protein